MSRFVLWTALCLPALAGCGATPSSAPLPPERAGAVDPPPGATALLSAEQKNAWGKLRLRDNAARRTWLVVGFVNGRWQAQGAPPLQGPSKWVDGLGFPDNDRHLAEKKAENAAHELGVEATAVVDLFREESPQVVTWFRDDGGVKRYEMPPSADLGDSLKQHLFDLQKRAIELVPGT